VKTCLHFLVKNSVCQVLHLAVRGCLPSLREVYVCSNKLECLRVPDLATTAEQMRVAFPVLQHLDLTQNSISSMEQVNVLRLLPK
jgi:hypothetical protein